MLDRLQMESKIGTLGQRCAYNRRDIWRGWLAERNGLRVLEALEALEAALQVG